MSPRHRTLLVGACVAYMALVAGTAAVNPAPNLPLVAIALAFWMATLIAPLLVYRDSWAWFHPFVWGLIAVGLGLARRFPLFAYGLDFHIALPGHGPAELNRLIAGYVFLHGMGQVAYYAGFAIGVYAPVPEVRLTAPRHLRRRAPLLVAAGLAVAAIYLLSRGGLTAHMLSWTRGRGSELAGDHMLFALASVSQIAVLAWLAHDDRALLRPGFWCCVVVTVPVPFLLSGSRSAIAEFLALGFAIYMLRRQRIVYLRALVLAVVLVYVTGVLGDVRSSVYGRQVDWEGAVQPSAVEQVTSTWEGEMSDRSTIAMGPIVVLARVPNQVDLLWGESYLAALVAPVPRMLWDEKPKQIGSLVGRTFYGSPAGVPIGPVAEAYWNFHIVGVLFVFAVFGVAHRWLLSAFVRTGTDPTAVLFYVMMLHAVAVPDSASLVRWFQYTGPLVVVLYALGIRIVRPSRAT